MPSVQNLALRVANKVVSPFIPDKNLLTFRYWLNQISKNCESELRYIHKIGPNKGVAIDVGANEGMYSYRMSKLYSKVYSFEINDELTHNLVAYNPGNIEIIHKGLSSQAGKAILYIPVLNGLPLVGWASLAPGNCPDTQEHLQKSVEICLLDAFKLQSVSLIKIDVEGHEVEVLKGALQTISANRPVVLIEIKDQNIDQVSSFFTKLDYQKLKLENLMGITSSQENYIFIPNEKAEKVGNEEGATE